MRWMTSLSLHCSNSSSFLLPINLYKQDTELHNSYSKDKLSSTLET